MTVSRVMWLSRIGFLLAAVGLAAIIWAADQYHLPRFITILYNFPYGDKVGHAALLGMVSLFANLGFPPLPSPARWRITLPTQILMVLITLEEISQIFFANRSFSVSDLLFSWAGIVAADWLAWQVYHTLRRDDPCGHPK